MPRKPRISDENVLRILMANSIHFLSGELPAYSHPVWKNLEEQNKAWSSHNWYDQLRKNTRELWTKFLQMMAVEMVQNETLQSTLDSSIGEYNDTLCIVDRDDKESEKWFDCYLQQEEWTQFTGLTMENWNDKIQCKLAPDTWEILLDTVFWKQNRLPCVFSFIGAVIDTSARIFLKIAGHCRSESCANEFYGYSDVKPSANNDELHIRVRSLDTRKIEHQDMHPVLDLNRKRRLEKEVLQRASTKKTTNRSKKPVSPPVPDDSAPVQKQEIDDPKRKKCTQDPIKRIYEMQFDQNSFGSIHDISYVPFYTQYGLSAQTIIYKTYSQSTRSATISIGTGVNCCRELIRPKGLPSAAISLHAIVIKFDDSVFSVYQMLAEAADTAVLEFWIKRWMRRVNSRPKQVISPYSLSTLSACVDGFNNLTIQQYIQFVLETLMRNEELPRDLTIIRTDPSELAQIILGWSCVKSIDSRDVRQFYVKSIAVLATCRVLAEFKEVFSLICAVACQNYDDSVLRLECVSTTRDARRKLQNLFPRKEPYMDGYWEMSERDISKDSPLSMEDSIPESEIFLSQLVKKLRLGDYITEADINLHNSKSSAVETFIQNLISPALLTAHSGSQLNAYFLPAIMVELFRLGKQFPIWTAVSIPASCLNQSNNHARFYVENCKRKFAKSHEHPTGVDGFLKFHLQDLAGNEVKIPPSTSPSHEEELGERHVRGDQGDKYCESQDSPHAQHIAESPINPLITEEKLNSGHILNSIPSEPSRDSPPSPPKSKFCASSSVHQPAEVPLGTNSGPDLDIPMFENYYWEEHAEKNTHGDEEKKLYDLVYGQRPKGKFFRDVSEIQVMNTLESRTKNVFFLRHGSVSPAVVVDSRKFKVDNTCAFDSITRILITSALDFPDYRSFVHDSDDQLMRFVNLFLTKATNTQILQERIRILSPHYKWLETRTNRRLILTTFDAFDNLTKVWKLSVTSEPSALSVLECQKCNSPLTPCSALSANHWIIEREGFKALEKALQFNSLLFNVLCQECGVGVICRTIPNRHLFIELDVRVGHDNMTTKNCQLDDFPEEISLEMKEIASNQKIVASKLKYRLAGVIDLTGGHYTAYSKRLSGSWELYNDYLVKTHPCNRTKRVNPHGAIYILKAVENPN